MTNTICCFPFRLINKCLESCSENYLLNNKILQYLTNFVYEDDSLKYIINTEGKLTVAVGENLYSFFIKDHLGNTRLVVNEEGIVSQQNAYYPFGMRMAMANSLGDATQKYLYNGKEEQDATGWLDYGARMYDAGLGRFFIQDRFAEKYFDNTPYHYGLNDPISNIDINGDSVLVKNNNIVGYIIEKGQGPSQVAADINNPETQTKHGYTLNTEVDYLDIVESNPDKFSDVKDVTDPNDKGFESSDMKEGGLLSIIKVLDRESEFNGNEKHIGSLSEKISGLDKVQKSNEKSGDAAMKTSRQVRQDGFMGAPGMSLGFVTRAGIHRSRACKYKARKNTLSQKKDSLQRVNDSLKVR